MARKATTRKQASKSVAKKRTPATRGQKVAGKAAARRREPSAQRARIDLTLRDAQEFADKLLNDDKFRAALERNPRRVMDQYGINIAPNRLPRTIKLPSKEALQKALT